MSRKAPKGKGPNHFVGEWFGQRIFPDIQFGPASIETLRSEQCPFLTSAKGEATQLVGGWVHRLIAGRHGAEIYADTVPVKPGESAATMKLFGIDLFDTLGTIGPCFVAPPGIA